MENMPEVALELCTVAFRSEEKERRICAKHAHGRPKLSKWIGQIAKAVICRPNLTFPAAACLIREPGMV